MELTLTTWVKGKRHIVQLYRGGHHSNHLMVTVPLSCTIDECRQDNDVSVDTDYDVNVNRNANMNANANRNVNIQMKSRTWTVPMPPNNLSTVKQNRLLFARLYVDITDENGTLMQALVACGCGGTHIDLLSIENKSVGFIEINGLVHTRTIMPSRIDTRKSDQLISKLNTAHALLHATDDNTFTSVRMHMDRVRDVPLLLFTLHARRIQSNANAPLLFERMLAITQRYLSKSQSDDSSVLAEMLTYMSMGWIYRQDCMPGNEREPRDFWTNLFSFPDIHIASFDCEDGSKALYELFLVFIRTSFLKHQTKLIQLQQLARHYTPFMAIVQLKSMQARECSSDTNDSQSDYSLHCITLLIDSREIDAMLQFKKVQHIIPNISLESTAFASCSWTLDEDKHTLPRDMNIFETSERVSSQIGLPCSHVRQPRSMLRRAHMYGDIFSMFTSDHHSIGTLHIVFGNKKVGLGQNMEQFLLQPCASESVTVIHSLSSHLEIDMCELLACMPVCTIPESSQTSIPECTSVNTIQTIHSTSNVNYHGIPKTLSTNQTVASDAHSTTQHNIESSSTHSSESSVLDGDEPGSVHLFYSRPCTETNVLNINERSTITNVALTETIIIGIISHTQ